MPLDTLPTDAPAAPVFNPEGLRALGVMLSSRFTQYETDRRLAELKWMRNARQYLGVYDPDIEAKIDPNRSRAYPKMTRVKCVSMLARLMNLLFQESDKCWAIEPSPVPNLEQEDLQAILDMLMPPPAAQPAQANGMPAPPPQPPSDEQIEKAIYDFAKKRAGRLELEIEDQLSELGGKKALSFIALCRKVLASGIQFGMGVLKGPFVEEQEQRTWKQDASGRLMAIPKTVYRPRYEFVSIWDYYPDMSAKYFMQMDGQFQRAVMSKHQVAMLEQRDDFIASQVKAALARFPNGNYKRRTYETELRSMGVQVNVTATETMKYELLIWEGYVQGKELAATGQMVSEENMNRDVRATVWLLDNIVLKADIDPWSKLDTDGELQMYHHFIFEDDESALIGNGLPNIVRDSQMSICAAVRTLLDNASVMRNLEVNLALLKMDQDVTMINPDKIWYRDDDDISTAGLQAIRTIEFPSYVEQLETLVRLFQGFADQETFVGPATGGDMSRGPSEPFRTAAGASMLRGDAALPFKDVVRNFDIFTESVINSLIIFNKNFNPDPRVRGDFTPVARGATSLIAKEVQGIQIDNLAATLTQEEKLYINAHELLKARVRTRDLEVERIVVDDDEAERRDQAQAQQQQAQADKSDRMVEAQIRSVLAETLKSISQAGKNSAAAEATSANVILDSLEKGINPDDVANPLAAEAQRGGGPGGGAQAAQPGVVPPNVIQATQAPVGQGARTFAAMPAR